ncbi:hypothetical protein VB776_02430 [Arcicella sp. DC2W]|uniref:Uncharacterized protein n=1 Tax=Arcicella gelida TaxID=2984195 RepID=A0ABU5S014_9BACT|nr:hypothetical protein [Arcicella sp. DC2W]MEA5401754.1 hypothetical protein [Arcicella sp. DC2W]
MMTKFKVTILLILFFFISEMSFAQVSSRAKQFGYRGYPSVIDADGVSNAIKQRTQSVYANTSNIQEKINRLYDLNENLQYVDSSKYAMINDAIGQLIGFLNSKTIDITNPQNNRFIDNMLRNYEDGIKKAFNKEQIIIPVMVFENGQWIKKNFQSN